MSYKEGKKILSGYPRTHLKIPGFLYIQNPGIFQGFFDPGISRCIPGQGYPVDIPSLNIDRFEC